MALAQRSTLLVLILALAAGLIAAVVLFQENITEPNPDLVVPDKPAPSKSDPKVADPSDAPVGGSPGRRGLDAAQDTDGASEVPVTEEDETPKPNLLGTTVDEIGRRVPGVHLIARDDGGRIVEETDSDENGHFAIVLEPGLFELTVRHPTYYSPGPLAVTLEAEAEPKRVELRMKEGGLLQGRVVDPQDRAVPQAQILVVPAGGARGNPAQLRTRSQSDGRFLMEGLPADATLLVLARAEGFGDGALEIELQPGQESEPVTLSLGQGGEIAGRVTSEGAPPASPAQVSFYLENDPWNTDTQDVLGDPIRQISTDREGTYRVRGLPAGSYTVIAEHGSEAARASGIAIESGEISDDLDLELGQGLAISGQITSGDGERLSGARVTARSGGLVRHAVTDDDGLYRVTGLTTGAFTITVESEGSSPAVRRGVEAGSEKVDFILVSGDALAGTVTSERTGEVLRHFRVLVDPIASEGERVWQDIDSEDGRFRIEGLAPGLWLLVVIAPEHRAHVEEIEMRRHVPKEDLDIRLPPGGTLSGAVMDGAERTPIAGAEVAVEPLPDPQAVTRTAKLAQRLSQLLGNPPGRPLTTDENGRFEIEGLPSGLYKLQVSAEYYLPTEAGPFDPGQGTEALVYLQIGGTIYGTVYLPSSRPAGGAVVTATNEEGVYQRVEADDRGRYEIFGLPPGPYFLTFSHPRAPVEGPPDRTRRAPIKTVVQAGVRTLQDLGFSVSNDVRFFGRIVDRGRNPSGASAEFVNLDPSLGGEEDFKLTSKGGGVLEKESMAAGLYQVTIRLKENPERTYLFRVDVPAVPEFSYEFVLGQGSISGTVVREKTREPLADVLVYASLTEDATTGEKRPGNWHPTDPFARTDAKGSFQITGLQAGHYTVRTQHVGQTEVAYLHEEIPRVPVPRDADYRLPTIVLLRGETLRVRLEGQGGERISEGGVALYTMEGQEVLTAGTPLTDD
ncbi:MAG: carboxypeptidase regulatory-like domain-containing protein, partial [Planctomycetota bacterium]